MPVYAYRREDGTTFEIKQKFLDDPLTVCPTTGQSVTRIVTAPGIIFKGSGFYVTDNAKASKQSANGNGNGHKSGDSETTSAKSDSAESSTKSETKSESKSDSSSSSESKKATA